MIRFCWLLLLPLFLGITNLALGQDRLERFDSSLGKIYHNVTGQTCTPGSLNEYRLATAKLPYGHVGNKDFVASSGASFFEPLIDDVLFQSASRQIYDMNKCQTDFFGLYFSDSSHQEDLNWQAATQFLRVKHLLRQDSEARQESAFVRLSEMVTLPCQPSSGDCAAMALEIDKRYSEDLSPNIKRTNALVNSIPLGNRPQMRRFLINAANQNLDESRFISGYVAKMRELHQEATQAYNNIASYSYSSENGLIFRVNEDNNSSLRRSLVENGVVQNIILQNNLEEDLSNGLICRHSRTYVIGPNVRLRLEIVGALIVPYASASLALRAGLMSASSGSKIVQGTSVALNAFSRSVLFANYGVQGLAVANEVYESCVTPEYLTSKTYSSCDASKQMYEVRAEASIAECILTASLGVALPAAGHTFGRFANQGTNEISVLARGTQNARRVLRELPRKAQETINSSLGRIRKIRMSSFANRRAEILSFVEDIDLRRGFSKALDLMASKRELGKYIRDLQATTFTRMLESGDSSLIRKANLGELDKESLLSVLRDRVRARGARIVTIRESLSTEDFNKKIGQGFLVDHGFSEGSDHGTYTHLLQQDFTYDVIANESGKSIDDVINFLGTPKGMKLWDRMYDGNEDDFLCPEFFTPNVMRENLPIGFLKSKFIVKNLIAA